MDNEPNKDNKQVNSWENSPLSGRVVLVVAGFLALFVIGHMIDDGSKSNKTSSSERRTTSSSSGGTLKKEALICTSKSAFDNQIDYLSSGNLTLAGGCFIIPVAQPAELLESSWNGECKVRRKSDRKVLYTLCEDFSR